LISIIFLEKLILKILKMERQVSGFDQFYQSILHQPVNRKVKNTNKVSLDALDLNLGSNFKNYDTFLTHRQFAEKEELFLGKDGFRVLKYK
jgi:hypothetical protein